MARLSDEEKEKRKKDKKIKEYNKNHKEIDRLIHKKCSRCEQWMEMSEENFYLNKLNSIDGYYPYCKSCTVKKTKQWRNDNREYYLEEQNKRAARLYDGRREELKFYSKQRLENGKHEEWVKDNPDRIKGYRLDRRHKDHDVTKKEWRSCKKYFDNECAYCGLHIGEHFVRFRKKIIKGDFHKEHVDHEGSIYLDNCVPSCGICNSEKHTYKLEEWYNEKNPKFSIKRLNKIYKWINRDYESYMQYKNTVVFDLDFIL